MSWEGYYQANTGRMPRPVFLEALTLFAKEGPGLRTAVDLGCGDGVETYHLLKMGWQVLAIDQEPGSLERVRTLIPAGFQMQLETRFTSFEQLSLPPVDFVYAGYSLPFCHPDSFTALWAEITTALVPRGRFAGQLFGVRDSWATREHMTFHTREQVEALLIPFEVELLDEMEEDGNSFSGPKHWHIFHLIARKK
ncbi:MAG: class I SAM-dependent methyltransferase [Anaerolineales bacterium]|nr:class I SAM-dependent methyltransferase [Anaerolineales bacterium]